MGSLTEKYIEDVLRTEPSIDEYQRIITRITVKEMRLLHAAMGLCTEAGEFMDMIKKHIMYGVPLDEVNLIEELGDGNWYEGIALDTLMFSMAEALHRNIAKLRKRFPEKFTQEAAINRDLDGERRILENKSLAMMCAHANEVPLHCPCSPDCYCKTHTCKPKEKDLFYHYILQGNITACGYRPATLKTYRKDKVTCEECISEIRSTNDFARTHMSVKGVTTVCGEDTSQVAYYTSNLNDVTCDKCITSSKVNYGSNEDIIHYNEHGLDIDGVAAKPICKAAKGKMISIMSSVTCPRCITILERAGYNVRESNPNKT